MIGGIIDFKIIKFPNYKVREFHSMSIFIFLLAKLPPFNKYVYLPRE